MFALTGAAATRRRPRQDELKIGARLRVAFGGRDHHLLAMICAEFLRWVHNTSESRSGYKSLDLLKWLTTRIFLLDAVADARFAQQSLSSLAT